MLSIESNQPASQNVSRETFSAMSEYVSLLLKWNAKINLIGPATEPDIWQRHIEDSLQLVSLIPKTATSLVDLGSGAGLPGMVIAIACPHLAVTLVEQDQRKAAFLTEAKTRLSLVNVTVKAMDIAKIEGQFDVISARALSSLNNLLSYAFTLMGQGAIAIFPKGEHARDEMDEARQFWGFEYAEKQSKTHAKSIIVTVSKLTILNKA